MRQITVASAAGVLQAWSGTDEFYTLPNHKKQVTHDTFVQVHNEIIPSGAFRCSSQRIVNIHIHLTVGMQRPQAHQLSHLSIILYNNII